MDFQLMNTLINEQGAYGNGTRELRNELVKIFNSDKTLSEFIRKRDGFMSVKLPSYQYHDDGTEVEMLFQILIKEPDQGYVMLFSYFDDHTYQEVGEFQFTKDDIPAIREMLK